MKTIKFQQKRYACHLTLIWNPIIVYYIESNLAKYLRPEF